ncbi:hypothetical protein Slin15195_G021380 [Septoria linicola]|uniref:Yeast cell wall synthesis Kre9/Knh1-like N-terminal domain-containing protein n=1 Tax=Septoria linicola TaxID=215465 RepID=A0A9Q9AJ54_9PEZI|nr:hypothetical protein Slin15195_G021380 [Septoria linicola]
MFSKALIAGLIGFAAAYTKPTGSAPEGNPISQPGLNSIVPAGEPFIITWNPTTQGTVTLVLLKGPSENAVPQYPIVEGTPNNGTYSWTPKTDLTPTEAAQGYGIQLIDDATGQYQYTTQFGISNSKYQSGSESKAPTYGASTSSVEKPKGYETKTAPVYSTKAYSTGYIVHPTGGAVYPSTNVTMVAPTGYKPTSTLQTSAAKTTAPSATYEGPAQQTGAASNVAISFFGLVAAAGAAVLAI